MQSKRTKITLFIIAVFIFSIFGGLFINTPQQQSEINLTRTQHEINVTEFKADIGTAIARTAEAQINRDALTTGDYFRESNPFGQCLPSGEYEGPFEIIRMRHKPTNEIIIILNTEGSNSSVWFYPGSYVEPNTQDQMSLSVGDGINITVYLDCSSNFWIYHNAETDSEYIWEIPPTTTQNS